MQPYTPHACVLPGGHLCYFGIPKIVKLNLLCSYKFSQPGVHNTKAEECTTPRIGSRNIKIKVGGGGLPRNKKWLPLLL